MNGLLFKAICSPSFSISPYLSHSCWSLSFHLGLFSLPVAPPPLCPSICLSVCLSVCLSLSVCLFVCLSVCLSVSLSLSLSLSYSFSAEFTVWLVMGNMRTSVCLFAFHRSPGTDLHFPITVVCVSVQQDSYDEPVVSFTVLIPMAPPRGQIKCVVWLQD